MKRFFSFVILLISFFSFLSAQQARYVFYFIGDGMGFNHVHATELYLAALSGSQDSSLLFTKFPYAGIVKTFSKNKSITDSAAAGTALSTGVKTINGTIGMDSAMQCSLQNVAESAHAFGRPVGILSTVSIDHATPAAFYAHKPLRSSFYEIGSDLPVSGYEFFAGAGFIDPGNRKHKKGVNLFDQVIENGYTVIRGMQAYRQHPKDVDKIILLQEESCNSDCVPFAIDRKAGDLSLPEMTKEAIDFLYARNAGFFMMVEGGMIDWAAHSNDAATTFREVIDFDHAIRNAFDFYKAHPDSTLIVVTADHETGGLGIGTKRYTLDMPSLAAQANSKSYLSKAIRQLNKEASRTGNPVEWQDVKSLLTQTMGFWNTVQLTPAQEELLYDAFIEMSRDKDSDKSESEYFRDEKIAQVAVQILNSIARIGWTTSSHTAGYIPVFAIGAGADQFSGLQDNTEIPRRISKIAGYSF